MANPWDPFPFPLIADDNQNDTYYGVGIALTGWEAIEFELARLYTIFAGDPDGEVVRKYGEPSIFNQRIIGLNKIADSYFVKHPNQQWESEYKAIADAAIGFSARRNDIAHGIVMNVAKIEILRERIPMMRPTGVQTLLIPPYHTIKRHDGEGLPAYAYNKIQLEQTALNFFTLELGIKDFRNKLLGKPLEERRKPLFQL